MRRWINSQWLLSESSERGVGQQTQGDGLIEYGLSAAKRLSRLRRVCGSILFRTALLSVVSLAINLSVVSPASAVAGTPNPSTVLQVIEDFQNLPTPTTATPAILLTGYTGPSPLLQTYTANPSWLTNCNGLIASWSLNPADAFAINATNCETITWWNQSQMMAWAMSTYLGQPTATAKLNYAITAYTVASPGANRIVLQSTKLFPVSGANKFLTFGVVTATQNCPAAGASLNFSLTNAAGIVSSLSSATTNSCTPTDPITYAAGAAPALPNGATSRSTIVGKMQSQSSVLGANDSYNLTVTNANGAVTGNDWAFDNVTLYDSTPQLDKSFAPTSIASGGTSTLTLTITNTTELASKVGWSFTDILPSGMTVAATPAIATTCPTGTVTAIAGSNSISIVNGSLTYRMVSCTVRVNVTASAGGTYVNGASNVTSVGLLPTPDATLTVTGPNVVLSKTSASTNVAPSAAVPFVINLGNSGTAASPTTITVRDVLPAGMMATSASVGAGVSAVSCTNLNVTGATLTCTVTLSSAMAAGAALGTAKFTINTVAPSSLGSVTNYAAVSPTGGTTTPTPGASCTPAASCGSALVNVLNLPTVTISKISTGGTGTFSFSGDNGFGVSSITTTAASTAVTGAAKPLAAAGTVTTITEAAQTGYALSDVTCTGLGAGGTATPNLSAGTVTLDAAATVAGSNIACTFTNSAVPYPTLTIQKISTGGVGSFNFSGNNGFGSDSITTSTEGVATSGVTKTLSLAGVATTITEEAFGFNLTGVSCTGLGAGGTATANIAAGSVLLNAAATAAGSNIVCTFTNVKSSTAPNILLFKAGPATGVVGNALPYVIKLGNSGTAASGTTIKVLDQLPAGVSAYSAMPSTGVSSLSCLPLNTPGALLTCTVRLASALTAKADLGVAKFTINTRASLTGTVVNYASVDPTGGNNPPSPGPSCLPTTSCSSASTTISAKTGSSYW